MNYKLNSVYAPYIKEYIDLKRSLNIKFKTEADALKRLDKFFIDQQETVAGITKELSDEWCKLRDNESNRNHYHRCQIFAAFSSYLNLKHINSYVPRLPPLTYSFVPYVFSKPEINRIFNACDNMNGSNKNMRSIIFSVPALFRTLYGTGIRIGEALSLTNADIHLDDKYITIRNTKNKEDRIVPISNTLSLFLQEYVNHRDKLPIDIGPDTSFFVSLSGKAFTRDVVYIKFHKILSAANIPRGNIRIHDLRHTFAVHSLVKMTENGLDLYCSLPIMSLYLGHKSVEATSKYVRLTAEMYPELIRKIDLISFNIFPQIKL